MRNHVIAIESASLHAQPLLDPATLGSFEHLDLLYRTLCALLYNYAPASGHPGGSISCGRFVSHLLFSEMEYDLGRSNAVDADRIVFAAGHKAMGLYALWALRDEIARIAAPDLLAPEDRGRLRLEDLLGFRRNRASATPLMRTFRSKVLDGHPLPTTPFVPLTTGASGVGLASAIGVALAASDLFGKDAPRIHIVEGEGGLTPGRVSEALAAAASASLENVVLHVDYNQASIDTDHVCREGETPGDYVQWTPQELCRLHDWNVITVEDGRDLQQIASAHLRAREMANGQPTAIIYRTIKGWQYGIEGRASHGAGHAPCSTGFYEAVKDLAGYVGSSFPRCAEVSPPCRGTKGHREALERCFWEALELVRSAIEAMPAMTSSLGAQLRSCRERLLARTRSKRSDAPQLEAVYTASAAGRCTIPQELLLRPGSMTTLRGELGRALQYLNRVSSGAVLVASADLMGSTSMNVAVEPFGAGFWNAHRNTQTRAVACGGICEDAMAGILSGIAAFGHHLPVGSSYAAFLAPLAHIAARLHAIGADALRVDAGVEAHPMILVCGHAGLTTGEDGPTHADVQALQLLQENFPAGLALTLTPWEPQELWPMLCAALAARPAVIAVFVPRPLVSVPDRAALGFPSAIEAAKGLVYLRSSPRMDAATILLQESGVVSVFVREVLPRLDAQGVTLNVAVVTSAELFDQLSVQEQDALWPESRADDVLGITGFTPGTMARWVASVPGRRAILHPYRGGHYAGSGHADEVLAEVGLDAEGQYKAVERYLHERRKT